MEDIKNNEKYSGEKAKGRSKKYIELQQKAQVETCEPVKYFV